VSAGEIVGMAGLIGAGRSEVAKAIFGLDRRATGRVEVDGKLLARRSPRSAMAAGIGFVPEDRQRQGLVLQMSCRRNFALPNLPQLSRLAMLTRSRERQMASDTFAQVDVRAASIELPAGSLSGGNQQKVVLAKWLARTGKLLIVDEPTRGVDVGAKAAIHQLLLDLAAKGLGILLISSELPELLNVTSRILVMREGHLVAEVSPESTTQHELLRLMSGLQAEGHAA
jgi:ABC-type sugar transport system ATPase subunit